MLGLLMLLPIAIGWIAVENSGLFGEDEEESASETGDIAEQVTNGDDSITGFEGRDIIIGLEGNDTINANAGNDQID